MICLYTCILIFTSPMMHEIPSTVILYISLHLYIYSICDYITDMYLSNTHILAPEYVLQCIWGEVQIRLYRDLI